MISVLVPAYNAAAYLPTALDSLLSQRVDLEIVVCDDGSSDGTLEIARGYMKLDPRIKVLSQPNSGAAAARNAALRHSIGDSIFFFDADDFLAPGSLAAMCDMASRYPGDGVYAPWIKFAHAPNTPIEGRPSLDQTLPGWRWLELAFQLDEPTYVGRFLLPRNVVQAVGGWNERLGFQDDMEFFARVIARLPVMHYCPNALFCYRQGVAGSISNTRNRQSTESLLLATKLAVRHLLDAKDTPRARRAAARQLMLVAHVTYLHTPDISAEAERLADDIAPSIFDRPSLRGGIARRAMQLLLGWKKALRLHNWIHARLRRLRR